MNPSLPLSLAILMAGCASSTDDSADPETAWQPDRQVETFFSLDRVHRITVDLDDDAWGSLLDDPNGYVRGDVDIDGATFADVGVRLKGGAGSFVPLDGDYPEISGDGNGNPGKSALILNLDKFVDDQEHLGIEKLTLNNMVQDESCIHETAAYALWREGGVPAPRTAYADLTLNGEDRGLFLLVEAQDNSQFLEDWFGNDDGNLYEGEYGTDLREEHAEHFDQDNGDEESRDDLRELGRWLDEAEAIGGDEGWAVMAERVDMEAYVAFATTEIFLGHWDGYTPSMNNYKIHHDLDRDRWTFLPWGADQTFEDQIGPYGGVMMELGPTWNGGRIHQICFGSPRCMADLHGGFLAVMERVETMDLVGLSAEAQALVESRALAEATAHGDPEITEEAWEQLGRFVEERPHQLHEFLGCLAGEFVDHDEDGWDGCTEDPEDYEPGVGP